MHQAKHTECRSVNVHQVLFVAPSTGSNIEVNISGQSNFTNQLIVDSSSVEIGEGTMGFIECSRLPLTNDADDDFKLCACTKYTAKTCEIAVIQSVKRPSCQYQFNLEASTSESEQNRKPTLFYNVPEGKTGIIQGTSSLCRQYQFNTEAFASESEQTDKQTLINNIPEDKSVQTGIIQSTKNPSSQNQLDPEALATKSEQNETQTLIHNIPENKTVQTGLIQSAKIPPHQDQLNSETLASESEQNKKQRLFNNLKDLRTRLFETRESRPQMPFQQQIANSLTEIQHNKSILKDIYVVVDTNIFITCLDVVREILEVKINGVVTPFIMVPWLTIEELDFIREDRYLDMTESARAAINYISEGLSLNVLKVQTVADAKLELLNKTASDAILHCCKQLIKKRNHCILLSNDAELRTKVIQKGICAYSDKQIIRALDPYNQRLIKLRAKKIDDLMNNLSRLCSCVIFDKLSNQCGDVLQSRYSLQKDAPWTLQECLNFIQRHWQSLFSTQLPQLCLIHIDCFNKVLRTHNGVVGEEAVGELVQFGFALCGFLQEGFPCDSDNMKECLSNIRNIGDSLT